MPVWNYLLRLTLTTLSVCLPPFLSYVSHYWSYLYFRREICCNKIIILQNIDLHALTGWIPERVALRSSSKPFEKDKEFRKILDKFHRGHCVVTVATGAMSQTDADRAGLVESHAYAMLDIREVLVSLSLSESTRSSTRVYQSLKTCWGQLLTFNWQKLKFGNFK